MHIDNQIWHSSDIIIIIFTQINNNVNKIWYDRIFFLINDWLMLTVLEIMLIERFHFVESTDGQQHLNSIFDIPLVEMDPFATPRCLRDDLD